MATKSQKQSFLSGAAVLASAVVIVKIISAVYKIPLGNILGSEGKGHFTVAYNIYNVLLTLSTAGLPLALSKLTSEADALGRENEKRRIFRVSLWLFLGLGLIGSFLMFFGTSNLAAFMNDELAYWPIKALAPAVVCVCLMACMRGYTQGQGNMRPTAISQILEALCKLLVGLSLAWYLLQIGKSVEISAAGAIFGVTVGTFMSLLFLTFYLLRHRTVSRSADIPAERSILLKRVLSIGIPITLSNSAMSIITLVDTKIVLGRLALLTHLADSPATLYGQYTFGMDLFTLAPSFVFPVTMSLIPSVSAAEAVHDTRRVNRIISSAFRVICLLAVPAGVGLSVLAQPILLLLYPAQRADAIAAASHLQVLGVACIFVCLMNLTNAILQSYGKERIPIYTMIAGGLVKISMNYVLVGNPDINIHGAPISTLCCYLTIAGLNLFFVYRTMEQKPRYLTLFFKPVLASILMGATARLTWTTLTARVGLSSNLSVLVAIVAGVFVYGILVIALRMLRAEDMKSLPNGTKLSKFLHLK